MGDTLKVKNNIKCLSKGLPEQLQCPWHRLDSSVELFWRNSFSEVLMMVLKNAV